MFNPWTIAGPDRARQRSNLQFKTSKPREASMGQCSCYADGVLQNSATIRSSAGFQQAIAFPVKFWPMESVTAMVCLQHGSQHGVTRQCDGPNLWFASLLPDPNKARSNGFRIWWCGLVRRNYSFLSYSSRSFVVQSGCEICRGEDSDTEPFCSVPRLHLREKKSHAFCWARRLVSSCFWSRSNGPTTSYS